MRAGAARASPKPALPEPNWAPALEIVIAVLWIVSLHLPRLNMTGV